MESGYVFFVEMILSLLAASALHRDTSVRKLLQEATNMFKQITPQRAQHSSGFIVQIGGRDSIQYLEQGLLAEVRSDLTDEIVPIYANTLAVNKAGNVPSGLTQVRAEQIIERIKSGLDCLGVKYEVV